jgi:hypothetical protein
MYLENFTSIEDVKKEFNINDDELEGVEILLAWYGYGDYCGDACVIFKRDGKYYTVNCGHCSCNGLEGGWNPILTDIEELTYLIEFGKWGVDSSCSGSNNFQKELRIILDNIVP